MKTPEFKIEKIKVEAKARKLDVKWTIEEAQIIKTINTDLLEEMQEELEAQIAGPLYESMGWHRVTFNARKTQISKGWCDKNLKGKYISFGKLWFFEREEDASWVMLAWK